MKTKATKLTVRLFLSRLMQVPGLAWRHLTANHPVVQPDQLRQFMGENFLSWADEYFSDDTRRNKPIPRKELYDNFLEYAPHQRKYIIPSNFKPRIRKYCEWKGYLFNPHKYDTTTGTCLFFDGDGKPLDDDKRGGLEYFTVGDIDVWIQESETAKSK